MRLLKECCKGLLVLSISTGLAVLPVQSQTYMNKGTVSGTWTTAGSPYVIKGDITVSENDTLNIEKGVNVQFSGYYSLTIKGTLKASGVRKTLITFTYQREAGDTTVQLDSCWRGIRVVGHEGSKDTSLFNNCRIEKVKVLSGTNEECLGGALRLDSGCYVILKNTTISKNQAHVGTAVYCRNSRCDISHVTVCQNTASSDGGAFCFINSNCTLNNSIVCNNTSGGNGGAVFSYGGSLTLINTVLSNNKARFGGAMALDKTSVSIINNTITDNKAEIEGAAIHSIRSQPRLVNSIVYNNQSRKNEQIYLFMNAGYDIQTTSIQGGLEGVDGMLYADSLMVSNDVFDYDPMFDGDEDAKYLPGKDSRCIDAGIYDTLYHIPGTDIRGFFRESNGRVDLGAYEYVEDTTIDEIIEAVTEDDDIGVGDKDSRYILLYPNPNRGSFTIEFLNSEKTPASIVICNIGGQKLYEQTLDNMQNTGYLEINTGLPDGIYSLQVYGVGNKLLESWKLLIRQ